MKNIFYELRKEKGLTQLELAKILNIRQTAVSKWERNQTLPDYPTLIRLADFYEVSTDYLLGREDDFGNVAPVGASSTSLTLTEQRLLAAFRGLDERRQTLIIEDAEYYVKKMVKA